MIETAMTSPAPFIWIPQIPVLILAAALLYLRFRKPRSILTFTGGGLEDGDQIRFLSGQTLPSGLHVERVYQVLNAKNQVTKTVVEKTDMWTEFLKGWKGG